MALSNRKAFFMDRMTKQLLRKQYLQKRRELSARQLHESSQAIASLFLSLDMSKVRYLHLFYPIVELGEIDVRLLAQGLKEKQPALQLVLPRMEGNVLKHILWTADTLLQTNSWGITEPVQGQEIEPGRLDAVLTPLLCFDKRGYRLGYGKGYYDAFLAACRPDVLVIGVSLFDPLDQIPAEPHDVPLSLCITPGKIWSFS